MLKDIFCFVLNLSLTGSIIAAAIIIVKKITEKIFPERWHYFIWFLLLIKLLVPFNFSSSLSLFNIIKYPDKVSLFQYDMGTPSNVNKAVDIEVSEQYPWQLSTGNASIQNSTSDSTEKKNVFSWSEIAAFIWLAGVLTLLLIAAFSYRRTFILTKRASPAQQEYISKLLSQSVINKKLINKIKIRVSDYHSSPFILGGFKPNIVIPNSIIDSLDEGDLKIILKHELIHLKHHDHIVRVISYLLQAIHWFNPIVWISLRLMARDCEIACDYSVINSCSNETRKKYAMLLLYTAQVNAHKSLAGLTAFCENNLRKRIVSIAGFRKHSTASFIAALLLLAVLVPVLMTGAANKNDILTGSFDNVKKIYYYQYFSNNDPRNYTLLDTPNVKKFIKFSIGFSKESASPTYFYNWVYSKNNKEGCRLFYDLINKKSGKTVLVHKDQYEFPALSVEITYKDGHTDYISSNSDGSKIYRVLGNGNYLEYTNPKLATDIKYLTLQAF